VSNYDYKEGKTEEGIIDTLSYIKYLDEHVPKVAPYWSGMELTDKLLEGYEPGEFIIIAGMPKHGKSLYMKTLIKQFYERGVLSVVFSFEERAQKFFETFEDGCRNLLFYVPTIRKPNDVDWLLERALEAKQKFGVKILFIDGGSDLTELSVPNLTNFLGDMMSKIKNFTVDHDFVTFLLWHLKKKETLSLDDLNDTLLKDTGMASARSDILLFMYRDIIDNGVSKISNNYLKIYHSRRSGTFQEVIPLVKQGYYLKEIDVGDV
jgi:hypothetical protein